MELLNSLPTFTKLFLGLLSIKVLIQNYLDLRQKKSLRFNIDKVPAEFSDLITLENHQKATRYNLERLAFGKFVRSYRLIILVLWTLGGGLELLGYQIFNGEISNKTSVFFLLSFIAIETLLGLPVSLYSTFKIEQKYGFNKTTPKIFISDLFKSLLLSVFLVTPLFLGLLYLLELMGEFWWIYSWCAFVLFQILLVFIYPVFIAPLFNKFKKLDDGALVDGIHQLLSKVNFNASGIFSMDASKRSTHGNAYFTGFGKNKRIVFFDTILNQMDKNEILAILAHELGHFKKKHILKSMVISFTVLLGVFYLLSIAIESRAILKGHGLNISVPAVSIILFVIISPVYSFLLTPLSNIFSRKNEFEADDFACHHTSSKDLKSALIKLYKFNYGALCPDEVFSTFYDSHPPAMIRIKNIDLK